MTNSVDLDEPCLRCHYPRGAHRTQRLGWVSHPNYTDERRIQFWQEGLCPDGHNMSQPAWDKYLFQGAVSGYPYEDLGVKLMHPANYPEFDSTPYIVEKEEL